MYTSIVPGIGLCERSGIQNSHIRILLNQLSAWNKKNINLPINIQVKFVN